MIKKYIKYLKRSPKHVQDYNLLIISGIFTSIIAVLWLHFYYGFFKFDFYNDITISESELHQSNSSNLNNNSSSTSEIESPIDQIMSIFNETKSRLQDIKMPEFGR